MTSKKDYIAISEIISKHIFEIVEDSSKDRMMFSNMVIKILAENLARYFRKENPRFDYDKFMKACGF